MENNNEVSIRDKYEKIFKPWLDSSTGANDYTTGMHRIIKTPKELATAAVEYFTECSETMNHITYIGLILTTGLKARNSLDKYKTYSDEYKELIDVIKLVVEETYLQDLFTPNGYKGANFILKTNYKENYSETIHQVIENRDFNINLKDPNEK